VQLKANCVQCGVTPQRINCNDIQDAELADRPGVLFCRVRDVINKLSSGYVGYALLVGFAIPTLLSAIPTFLSAIPTFLSAIPTLLSAIPTLLSAHCSIELDSQQLVCADMLPWLRSCVSG
jgi:hypothetical protein